MAYRKFKFIDIKNKFGIHQTTGKLFISTQIEPVPPTDYLIQTLEIAKKFPLTTEKAVSEALVYPVLQQVKLRNVDYIELFSGERLDADRKRGLTGECDFLFAKAPLSKEIIAPIINITEAKRGDIEHPASLAQTCAQLIGARFFNKKQKQIIEPLYGVCTSGFEWVFIKLEKNTLTIDTDRYPLVHVELILGIFQFIIEKSKK